MKTLYTTARSIKRQSFWGNSMTVSENQQQNYFLIQQFQICVYTNELKAESGELSVCQCSRTHHLQWPKVEAASLSIEGLKMRSVGRVEGCLSLDWKENLMHSSLRPEDVTLNYISQSLKAECYTVLLI